MFLLSALVQDVVDLLLLLRVDALNGVVVACIMIRQPIVEVEDSCAVLLRVLSRTEVIGAVIGICEWIPWTILVCFWK